jgi:tetratricopeptide (TPR) repeat protein
MVAVDAERRQALLFFLGRHELFGDRESLDQAIELLRELASAAPGPPDADLLNILCGKLWERFGHTGNLRDLDESIDRMRELVQRLDEADPRYPGLLHNLGLGLSERFRRLLQPADLDEAIRHYQSAIAVGIARGAVSPLWRNNLANALRDRAHLDRDVRYLDEAIAIHEALVRETPPGDRDYRAHRSNLANDLLDRYTWSIDSAGDPRGLNRASSPARRETCRACWRYRRRRG